MYKQFLIFFLNLLNFLLSFLSVIKNNFKYNFLKFNLLFILLLTNNFFELIN